MRKNGEMEGRVGGKTAKFRKGVVVTKKATTEDAVDWMDVTLYCDVRAVILQYVVVNGGM
jgi:hypothetical protein